MLFRDRIDAGRQLAERVAERLAEGHTTLLAPDRADGPTQPAVATRPAEPAPVVLGLPRGGVPVAAEVARRLRVPLDVILVRKLGVPAQPELGFGALGEGDVKVTSLEIMRAAGVTEEEATRVEARARAELSDRVRAVRAEVTPISLEGRIAVIVDDGLATGSTAIAACQVARAHGAARVILAVAVAPPDWIARCAEAADDLVAVATPVGFSSVGQWYEDFRPVPDAEVIGILRRARREAAPDPGLPDGAATEVRIPLHDGELIADLHLPEGATGVVLFAHGSGSSRHSPRNRTVAEHLQRAGIATVLLDLLTASERSRRHEIDIIGILGARLMAGVDWARTHPDLAHLPIGLCGASTGGAVAMWAAARAGSPIAAVVTRSGRPDLVRHDLADIAAPTLMIVGSLDRQVHALTTEASSHMTCERRLEVIDGATHLFAESGTLARAAQATTAWFLAHLRLPQRVT